MAAISSSNCAPTPASALAGEAAGSEAMSAVALFAGEVIITGGRHGLTPGSSGDGNPAFGAGDTAAVAWAVRSTAADGSRSSESIAPEATAVTSMPSAVARLATIIASAPSSQRTWSRTDRDVKPKNVRNFIACLLL